MAYLIPDNLKSRGDVLPALRRVANAFQVGLDENVLVWFEPLYDPSGEKPHFVALLPQRGIVVLEVFEAKAKNVLGFIRGRLRFERDGKEVEIHSPLHRAKSHAAALGARIAAEVRLRELDIPVVAGAVFPGIEQESALEKGLASAMDPGMCLFKEHIDAAIHGDGEAAMLRAFSRMFGGRELEITSPTVDILRGLIQPSIVISPPRKDSGSQLVIFREPMGEEDTIRVMDRKQEAMAKSLGEGHRVIRGVAGSGKTLVLVYRARLLARLRPQKRYLLTCYTKTLASQLQAMLSDLPNLTVRHLDGVMSDAFRAAGVKHPGYKNDGSGEGVATAALQALRRTQMRYDGIFVDEAQDFSTPALQFMVGLLKDGSDDLVIVADAAQNIFRRKFSWKMAGIHAQGRTRILRTNYRNTKEILEFAHRFLTAGSTTADEVSDVDDETAVIPPEAASRTGPEPEVSQTADAEQTIDVIVDKVKDWLRLDRSPHSVAILYASNWGAVMRSGLREALDGAGIEYFWATDPKDKDAKTGLATATEPVILSTIHSAKGLEFPRVALCELGKDDDELEVARKLAYVGMTRATDELFVATDESSRLAPDLVPPENSKQSGSAA